MDTYIYNARALTWAGAYIVDLGFFWYADDRAKSRGVRRFWGGCAVVLVVRCGVTLYTYASGERAACSCVVFGVLCVGIPRVWLMVFGYIVACERCYSERERAIKRVKAYIDKGLDRSCGAFVFKHVYTYFSR